LITGKDSGDLITGNDNDGLITGNNSGGNDSGDLLVMLKKTDTKRCMIIYENFMTHEEFCYVPKSQHL